MLLKKDEGICYKALSAYALQTCIVRKYNTSSVNKKALACSLSQSCPAHGLAPNRMPSISSKDRTPCMITLQDMLQWSASFHTRNNKRRAARIIAQPAGQGALACGI